MQYSYELAIINTYKAKKKQNTSLIIVFDDDLKKNYN